MRLTKSEKIRMLNNYDNLLLSVASLLGLLYAFAILLKDKTFYFYPLLIVGWGMPILGYAIRTLRFNRFSLEESVMGNFYGWTYLICGTVAYGLTLIIPTNSGTINLESLIAFVLSPIGIFSSIIVGLLIFSISWLRKKFLKSFEVKYRYPSAVGSLLAIMSYVLALFTCLVFYLGYAYLIFLSLPISLLIISGGVMFFASNIFLWPQAYAWKYFALFVALGCAFLFLSFALI